MALVRDPHMERGRVVWAVREWLLGNPWQEPLARSHATLCLCLCPGCNLGLPLCGGLSPYCVALVAMFLWLVPPLFRLMRLCAVNLLGVLILALAGATRPNHGFPSQLLGAQPSALVSTCALGGYCVAFQASLAIYLGMTCLAPVLAMVCFIDPLGFVEVWWARRSPPTVACPAFGG
ncbi:hypothetical protein V6N13_040277 [Hibiscus sabdariffa]